MATLIQSLSLAAAKVPFTVIKKSSDSTSRDEHIETSDLWGNLNCELCEAGGRVRQVSLVEQSKGRFFICVNGIHSNETLKVVPPIYNFVVDMNSNFIDIPTFHKIMHSLAIVNIDGETFALENKDLYNIKSNPKLFTWFEELCIQCVLNDNSITGALSKSIFYSKYSFERLSNHSDHKIPSCQFLEDIHFFRDIQLDVTTTREEDILYMESNPQVRIIDTFEAFQELIDFLMRLAYLPVISIDCEHNTDKFFYGQLALLQLAISYDGKQKAFLIDPLAPGVGYNLHMLQSVIERPNLIVLLHAGSSDQVWLYSYYSVNLRSAIILDTSRVGRELGCDKLGLKNLAAQYLNLTLDKTEQRRDWSARPLTARQSAYAANDVLILFPLITEMFRHLDGSNPNISVMNMLEMFNVQNWHQTLKLVQEPRYNTGQTFKHKASMELYALVRKWLVFAARINDCHPNKLMKSQQLCYLITELQQPQNNSTVPKIFTFLTRVITTQPLINHVYSLLYIVKTFFSTGRRYKSTSVIKVAKKF